jgi:hypothetical protein
MNSGKTDWRVAAKIVLKPIEFYQTKPSRLKYVGPT